MKPCGQSFWIAGGISLYCFVLLPSSAEAQFIQIDGTTPTLPAACAANCTITGGLQVGDNLFHSFSNFNVAPGRTVRFFDPGVTNVLSRVTGNNPSNIQGRLGVSGGDANLFLMNPNGIIFGRNASLDVRGSFVATTADAIRLTNGDIFSANPTAVLPTQLLNVNPNAFLFNQIATQPASIINQSRANSRGLDVPRGRSLLLVGGDVRLEDGRLRAEGGRIELGGVAEGTVELSINNNQLRLNFPDGVSRTDVVLDDARLEVTAEKGGDIVVHARNLEILGGSRLVAGISNQSTSPSNQAGKIQLNATGNINIRQSSRIENDIRNEAIGTGGNIEIRANSFSIRGNSQLSTRNLGEGTGGSILINVADSVTVTGGQDTKLTSDLGSGQQRGKGRGGNIEIQATSLTVAQQARLTASTLGEGDAGDVILRIDGPIRLEDGDIFSEVLHQAKGNGGKLDIKAQSVFLNNSARLTTRTFGEGNAGNIILNVDEQVRLEDGGRITSDVASGAAANSNGGNIEINARSLAAIRGGFVQASAGINDDTNQQPFTRQGGNAGTIRVNATEFVELSGVDEFRRNASRHASGFFTSTEQGRRGAGGKGGDIYVNTGALRLSDGAVLSAGSNTNFPGGNIFVETQTLEATGGGQLLATAFNSGDAGSISVNIKDTIILSGNDPKHSNRIRYADGPFSGFFARTEGSGAAGDLKIHTGQLIIRDGGQISASTSAEGKGGNIQVEATFVDLSGVAATGSSSGLFTSTSGTAEGGNITIDTNTLWVTNAAVVDARTIGSGKGGNILVNASTLEAAGGGQVLTTSRSSGSAGNITLNVADTITLSGSDPTYPERVAQFGREVVSNEDTASGLFANTAVNSTGNGGSIDIHTTNLNLTNKARISAESQGTGDAGNIEIRARQAINTDDAEITALAASAGGGDIKISANDIRLRNSSLISTSVLDSAGGGGNIAIDSKIFLALEDSDILANADEGKGGNITINSPAFLADFFSSGQATAVGRNPGDFAQFRGNGRVDISASSRVGISGSVNIPEFTFLQNSLSSLEGNFVNPDQVVAGSCIARRNREGSFMITGTGGLPYNPYDAARGLYEVTAVQTLREEGESGRAGEGESGRISTLAPSPQSSIPESQSPSQRWRLGDPVQEAQGMTLTAEGRIVVGTAPQLSAIATTEEMLCDARSQSSAKVR